MKNIILLTFSISLMYLISSCQSKVTKISEEINPIAEKPVDIEKKTESAEKENIQNNDNIVNLAFSDINFDYDKSDILPHFREKLAEYAKFLIENPDSKILIEGHCDERGTIEYNLALGDRRATAVKNYLVNYGISHNRINTISYGKERPIDPARNEYAWAKNRRAALAFQDK